MPGVMVIQIPIQAVCPPPTQVECSTLDSNSTGNLECICILLTQIMYKILLMDVLLATN